MPENLILRSIPASERNLLEPYLDTRSLALHDVLVEPDTPIDYVYFPLDCMISLVTVLENGVTIESATIGNEGMSGLTLFLGLERSPARAIVQMEGEALRMTAAGLKEALGRSPALRGALGRYADALISMLAQSGACNGLHSVEERLARWLLTIQDRTGREEFTITQDFLSQMLGTHRPTVTVTAGTLQNAGLVTHRHGHVRILDRARLEEAACECYGIIRDLYSLTLGVKGGWR